MAAGSVARVVDTAGLMGTWFVVRTSLPFWRKRSDPRITYRPLPGGTIDDLVEYTSARGRAGRVHGIDTPDPFAPGAFHWRGTGLTRLLTSHWRVLAIDEDWAVTFFGRTPFTPAGMDVYAREPHPEPELVARALAAVPLQPEPAGHVERLFAPRHA